MYSGYELKDLLQILDFQHVEWKYLENKISLTIDLKHFKSTESFLCCLVSLLLNKNPFVCLTCADHPKVRTWRKSPESQLKADDPSRGPAEDREFFLLKVLFCFLLVRGAIFWYLVTFNRKMTEQMVQVHDLWKYTLSWFLNDIRSS